MTERNGYGASNELPADIKFSDELSRNLAYGGSSETPANMSCYDNPMSRANLSVFVLKSFVKAIGSGDRDVIETLLGKTSPLTDEQKRALLSINYNYNHFIERSGIRMGTAIQLAGSLEKKNIVTYLTEQRAKLCPSVAGLGLFNKSHDKATADDTQELQNGSKIKPSRNGSEGDLNSR
ncbi:MAG: hypothetical protein Q8R24_10830 [Legionellaceae bacterium]|nr:hypothetical protein [Legionellaceae bacterium]